MTAADEAYRAAQRIIETVRTEQTTVLDLDFNVETCHALEHLPPEIGTLVNVTRIDLGNTQVADITPLQGLAQLQALSLVNTQVADITPLQGLTQLQTLSLANTQVADITPLQGLMQLQALSLEKTQVADITPLQGLMQLQALSLEKTQVADITPLQGLTQLQELYLQNTQVADITPLQGLAQLRRLYLQNTQVADITPLQGHAVLEDLVLHGSNIRDLRPIARLERLGREAADRLTFSKTPAVEADPDLKRLSKIEDHVQRAAETKAYLRTLPPWPEPLPWLETPNAPASDAPPEPPETDAVPTVVVSEDGRLDLEPSTPTEDDHSDPIKERLYPQLRDAVRNLTRYGNYPQVSTPASALSGLLDVPFNEADILSIHLQIGALMDAKEADADKRDLEKLDPDCMAAVNGVLRLGPPVTMGHPDVELLEKRALDYARTRQPETVAEGERQLAAGIAENSDLATERARKTSQQLATSSDTGRVAEYRHPFIKKAVVALGIVAGAVVDTATGLISSEAVLAAAQFVTAYKDAILAVAPSWGETGFKWAEYLIMRADQIIRDAREDD
ncbi:MAG: leucine-rich repeat domain-containing protein [Pseudomonadota bacterium]